jgi:XRE family aerobic/anaerobic benzoate catabolism transcriptional regulator
MKVKNKAATVKMPNRREGEGLSNEEFLMQVGSRIRGLRANRGMTRKMLSEDSTVSERYLANLEQGKGNISISLLRQIARALNSDISNLLPSNVKQSPEQSLISEFVGRLSREEQQSALQLLYQKFSELGDGHTRVALIGLRGAGKTTLGQLLEKRQNLRFVRLVDEIEAAAGMAIGEILALSGQAGYRRLEEKALFKTLNEHESCCIETGGSIVSELKQLNLLLSTCLVIWVSTSPEEHMRRVVEQGDLRPMVDNDDAMDDLRQILKERTPYYEKAHAILDTSGKTVEDSYKELVSLIRQHDVSEGTELATAAS